MQHKAKQCKKIMFIRYINAQCIIQEFSSFQSAVRYVYETSGTAQNRKLSHSCRKRIHGQIRDAIKSKCNYCGGQWIDATEYKE